MNPKIIIGSGIAGYMLIKKLRALDCKGPIILMTKDKGDYYFKPMLSNAFSHNQTPEKLVLTSGAEMAKTYDFELHDQCPVKYIDTKKNTIHTTSRKIQYDQLILACGSLPRQIPGLPHDSPYMFSVNHIEEYERFRNTLKNKKHITILGSGFVGCEFANDLVLAGYQVTVISRDSYPLQRLIPQKSGLDLEQKLATLGVRWYLGTQISGASAGNDCLYIHLRNEKVLTTELILSAIGIEPNKNLAKKSGIKTRKGIMADSFLRTNIENIFTLGDCAEINGKVWPFVEPIHHASEALVKTLLGHPTPISFPNFKISVKTPSYPINIILKIKDFSEN